MLVLAGMILTLLFRPGAFVTAIAASQNAFSRSFSAWSRTDQICAPFSSVVPAWLWRLEGYSMRHFLQILGGNMSLARRLHETQ